MPDKTKEGYPYYGEDDDGDDPCPSCGHDPCWCDDFPDENKEEEDDS
jgi:hypothetical protein